MNEIKLINVGGVDQNIKDQYVRDIIAPSENGIDSSTNLPVSSRHYDEGDYLIAQDRKYYEAITDIEVGDTLVVGTNIRATTVTEEILMLKGQSANVAIETIADMETAATASKAFATGKYVYWNYGVNYGLYEVISNIAQGDAFTTSGSSQNIKPANKIGDDISILRNTTTNPNLLDNPWFTVNQRGQSSYSGTSSVHQYVFDRWFLSWANSDVTVTKNSDGTITYTNNSSIDNMQIIQIIDTPEALANRQVTLSIDVVSVTVASGNTIGCMATLNASPWTSYARVNISSGGLYSKTGILGDASTLSTNGLKVLISLDAGESITFKAIKLELGSRSTLANDTVPNYQQELAKCQRYFFKPSEMSYTVQAVSDSYIYGCRFPVKMRLTPSITNIRAQDFFHQSSMITSGFNHSSNADSIISIQNTSAFTKGVTYYIDFEASADL